MLIKAPPAKSQIERIVGFQFWSETYADFKYSGVIRAPKLDILIDFHLYLWCFRNSKKTHFGPLGNRIGKGEIGHRNTARQSRENIMRIAQNGFVEVVQTVNILILAGLSKVKLKSAKMLMSARATKSQIGRIVGFQFWWETWAAILNILAL